MAAAAPCPAELVESTTTLAPTTMKFSIEITLYDPMTSPVSDSDIAYSGLTGVQGVRLDCGFDASSHAVTSVNSIVFLISYGDKIQFSDDLTLQMSYEWDNPFNQEHEQFASIGLVGTDFGGSLSTGLQDILHSRTPVPMTVTGTSFPLDIAPGTEGNSDLLFYLNQGVFQVNINYMGTEMAGLWGLDPNWQYPPKPADPIVKGSEAWNDANDMPGNGTVSASLSSVATGVATYDVDVSVPIYGIISLPNPAPGTLPADNPMGSALLECQLEFSGQFTREVPMLGDANGDRTVNDEDASVLGANWLQSGEGIGWAQGDFNGDHVVNDKDAAIMAAHYGETAPGGISVPEPSTAALLLGLALAGLAAWRRR
ncbi:MAG: VPDSG-CTERM sorting domain-containing protein [Planctomycetia bacterium]|nr:VPDSG-CTERM sorting domain-containing protein [Planctomycetia bacterium]